MVRWHSLFLSPNNEVDAPSALLPVLQAEGYEAYDPFGSFGGHAYSEAVRLFIAPYETGAPWQRILLEVTQPDTAEFIAQILSKSGLCISAWLEKEIGDLRLYQDGQPANEAALAPYQTKTPPTGYVEDKHAKVGDLAVSDMPEKIQELANQVKPKQAEKLFNKMTRRVFGNPDADAARALLQDAPDWHSEPGQRISSIMASLGLSAWREPDFATLRAAYTLHARLKRRPNATLLPGDDTALNAVPNALDYTPFYMGKAT